MKRLLLIVFILLLLGFTCGFTPGQKVYDQAGLLTADQITGLQAESLRIAQDKEVDVILLTVQDAGGRSAMAVADDFYDENGFGYEAPHGTGILFLIDMDNREAWISTSGKAIDSFTDQRIEWILDDIFNHLPDGDYLRSFEVFLASVETYMGLPVRAGEGPGGTVWWTNNWIQGGVAAAVALGAVLAMIAGTRSRMTAGNKEYMTGVRMNISDDQFLRRVVTARKIPQNTGGPGGSSTHRSGGGFSHGGGGRGF